jgi:hypothetical protein
LSSRKGHPFRPQDIADLALGNGYLEFLLEALNQFLLGESQVPFLLLSQPDSALKRHFVRVATAMVNERLPSGTSLAVATAEVGQ